MRKRRGLLLCKNKANFQGRDGFPRPRSGRGQALRGGRLCALLAMTGIGKETTTQTPMAWHGRQIVQNKANFQEPRLALTAVHKESYEKKMRSMPLRKQSQFAPEVSSFKLEVSSGHPALHTSNFTLHTSQEPPDGVTTSRTRCAKQSQFPSSGIGANCCYEKGL